MAVIPLPSSFHNIKRGMMISITKNTIRPSAGAKLIYKTPRIVIEFEVQSSHCHQPDMAVLFQQHTDYHSKYM